MTQENKARLNPQHSQACQLAYIPEGEAHLRDYWCTYSAAEIARLRRLLSVDHASDSADIGKLDAADKSGVEMGKVNRVDGNVPFGCDDNGLVFTVEEKDAIAEMSRIQDLRPARVIKQAIMTYQLIVKGAAELVHKTTLEFAGSAETGGERAEKGAYFEAQAHKGSLYMGSNYLIAKDGSVWDCMMWAGGGIADITQFLPSHPDFCVIYRDAVLRKDTVFEDRPTFRRTSQNHTVSSGVEGAHEGTTADKSWPREPEKLNNAHEHVWDLEGEAGEYWYECECGETKTWPDTALAESSLSEPQAAGVINVSGEEPL